MNAPSLFKASGLAAFARRLVFMTLAVVLVGCGGADEGVAPASKQALSTRSVLGSSTPGARELFGARAAQDSADFNGDGKADLLWYGDTSTVAWLMDGASLLGGAELLRHPTYKVLGTGDFNGDGKSDLVWHDATSGDTSLWLMDGARYTEGRLILRAPDRVIGTPDLNGDGKSDLLWYSEVTGYTTAWIMDGLNSVNGTILRFDAAWRVVALPDLNGDGKTDLVWHNASTGQTVAWLMDRLEITASVNLLTHPSFKVIGTPDLNGDGKSDLLWHDPASGQTVAWLMSGLSLTGGGLLLEDQQFKVIGTPDLDGDGKSDLLWYSATARQTVVWLMNGVGLKSGVTLMTDTDYRVVGTADLNGDGKSDLQWYSATSGQTAAWLMGGIQLTGGGELLASTTYRLTSASPADEPVTVVALRYDDANARAWGSGSDGQLYVTDPSSATWQARAVDRASRRILHIGFDVAEQVGWALGVSADPPSVASPGVLLLKTTDGGSTWARQALPDGWDIGKVEGGWLKVLDSQHVVLGHLGQGLVSADGGNTWTSTQAEYTTFGKSGTTVWSAVPGTATAAPQLRRSRNLGVSFDTVLTLAPDDTFNEVHFLDDLRGWAAIVRPAPVPAGVVDLLYSTVDGGASWQVLEAAGLEPRISGGFSVGACGGPSFRFVDAQRGIATVTCLGRLGNSDRAWRTADGGRTWARMTRDSFCIGSFQKNDIQVTAGGLVWTDGQCPSFFPTPPSRKAYLSQDVGLTWTALEVGDEAPTSPVLAVSTAPDGAILLRHAARTYRSADQGVSWQVVKTWPAALPARSAQHALGFTSADQGFAARQGR